MKINIQCAVFLLLLLAALGLSGCNTVKGIGEDFEQMGESIQNAGD